MSHARIRVELGDITTFTGDAIVNAANSTLRGGGGVDGAIHRAAGPGLLQACITLGGCPEGEARLTSGFELPARHVIHTVGPVWGGGGRGEDEVLASCYRSSLQLAMDHGFRRVAFPAISCGVYGYPIDAATDIAVQTVAKHLESNPMPEEVTFVCFDESMVNAYRRAMSVRG